MSDSPRDRILAAINHERLGRTPCDYWGTPEVTDKLCRHLGCDGIVAVYDRLGIDGIMRVEPPYIGPPLPEQYDGASAYVRQAWGMRFKAQRYPAGGIYWEQTFNPLAGAETIADLDTFPWPKPEWFDYSALPALCAQYPNRAIQLGYSAIFYYHNMLRGLEQSLADPLLMPEFTHHLLQKVSDVFYEYHARCFKAARGLVQLTQVTDDFGTQRGLMISPRVFREFYKPHIQRAIDLAKSFDLKVFHHDDGSIRPLIPELVEMGIDVLNPVQWRCADMDPAELKDSFGDRVCFHGGIDNQDVMPFGTPQDVRDEVIRNLETLGRGGTGYIVAPCHNLQVNTSVENILALYETVRQAG
jgi:uroporphyrinogen decarboxylase